VASAAKGAAITAVFEVRPGDEIVGTSYFSLGSILFEMVTGQRAFARQTTIRRVATLLTHTGLSHTAHEITTRMDPERLSRRVISRHRVGAILAPDV
jgi:hypothetical protein